MLHPSETSRKPLEAILAPPQSQRRYKRRGVGGKPTQKEKGTSLACYKRERPAGRLVIMNEEIWSSVGAAQSTRSSLRNALTAMMPEPVVFPPRRPALIILLLAGESKISL
jgi:hypothetical protein